MLENFTDHKREKIKSAMLELGAPCKTPEITSANRTAVRSWLNGLGFPTRTYENATLSELRNAYYSFTWQGCALGLVPFAKALLPVSNTQTRTAEEVQEIIATAISRASVPLQDLELEGVGTPSQGAILANLGTYTPPEPKKEETTMTKQNPEFWTETEPKAKPTAETAPAAGLNPEAMKAVAALMAAISAPPKAEIDESHVIALIKKHAMATTVEIKTDDKVRAVPTGLHHKVLPEVLRMLSAGVNVMMVGPAGSGKTTIAEQAALALDIPFYFNGALSNEYKLSGFMDAQGRLVSTAFRRAYETGGVYLFDEVDGSLPDALMAFNAALANGQADFPDGTVKRHKDFRCIAAANTYGRGGDRLYVGRNQLDASSTDRFCFLDVEYDERLERALSTNDNWTDFVQKIRAAVFDLKIRHIVSPRATINGAALLAAGSDRKIVEEATIWKGLDTDTRIKIRAKAGI
jgi:cobaltochelatase CobS